MATLADIKPQLEKPFNLEDIDFLPKGTFERDGKTFITGFPFADPRVYQDRLNTVCPGEWSTPQASVTIAGNKIITLVTVIICGVPHTDIGEASLDGPTKENAGTESWSQAFKRACSQAGLGRFLYSLDKVFLPYDKQRKRIDLDANALRGKARELYVKAGIIQRANNSQAQPVSAAPNTPQPTSKPAEQPAPGNAPVVPTAAVLEYTANRHLGDGAFAKICEQMQAINKDPNVNLTDPSKWQEKHRKHAKIMIDRAIEEAMKQPVAKAS